MNFWAYLKTYFEIIVAISALIISIVSIILTFWATKIQRKHNRLSVRPIPEILLSKIEGVKIDLRNLGVGPLRCIYLKTKDSAGITKPHMKDFLPEGLSLAGEIFTNRWGFTILPGESITLLSITGNLKNQSSSVDLEKAIEMLGDLTICLNYSSIYDENFSLYEKSLIWLKK